ncbi:hypothetical protein KXW38_000314, partial [Aspergillus fumigatus]
SRDLWPTSHAKKASSDNLKGAVVTTETDHNLGDEDRRSYRRWTSALLLSYVAAIAIAFGATYFGKPSGDQQAANETQLDRQRFVARIDQAVAPATPRFSVHSFLEGARTMQYGHRLLSISLLAAIIQAPMPALAGPNHVQFCWAVGKFDSTIYFAEVENREDRQPSFEQLLDISGIEHYQVQCT